jgi:phospholipid/cholesterol/gamma-HCH transport system permease protein
MVAIRQGNVSFKEESQILAQISFNRTSENTLHIDLAGRWDVEEGLLDTDAVEDQVRGLPPQGKVTFNTHELGHWDSALLVFLVKVDKLCTLGNVHLDRSTLPEGLRRLLALASAVPQQEGRKKSPRKPFPARMGAITMGYVKAVGETLHFIGESFVAFINLLFGRAYFRPVDLGLFLQECGANALPIVSLISFLVGLILAFVGAVQLANFGAQVYVADLVGLAMAREMGAMMVGIVMAGRTGAAFAAQIGTMKVNEEIDALVTLGISPVEFLVLPRMLALILMMPLLCLYADIMGILGGASVAIGMYDISWSQYLSQIQNNVGLTHFAVGIFKSGIFGIIVAAAGCIRGLESGRNAAAVGNAATSAVVTAILMIIISDAAITFICDIVGV